MKEITLEQLQEINGGSFLGGFCAVFGTANAIAFLVGASVVTSGVSGIVAAAATGMCLGYSLGTMFD